MCGSVCKRVDNSGGDGIEVVRKIKEAFVMEGIACKVSAASLKQVNYLEKAASRELTM